MSRPNHHAQVPPRAAAYFNRLGVDLGENHPLIRQEFTPGKGWRPTGFTKRVSASWISKLRTRGVTHVQLTAAGHNADFRCAELTATTRGTENGRR